MGFSARERVRKGPVHYPDVRIDPGYATPESQIRLYPSPQDHPQAGPEIAASLARGDYTPIRTRRRSREDRDLLPPVKDNVGCTITRGTTGEVTDYLRRRDSALDTPAGDEAGRIARQRTRNWAGFVPDGCAWDRTGADD